MPTPNEIGDRAEQRVNKLTQGQRVPQSGGGKFWKLDSRAGMWIISVKATTKSYIRITADMFREARQAARGVKGSGDGVRWMVVSDVDGYLVATLPLDDLVDLMTREVEPHITPSKAQERRMRARQ